MSPTVREGIDRGNLLNMHRPTILGLVTLIGLLLAVSAFSVGEKQTRELLVVIDRPEIEKTHSKLLKSLRDANFHLTVLPASSDDITLKNDGEYLYDGVALLCPTSNEIEAKLPIAELTQFLDDGRDVFVVAANGFSEYTRSAAKMVGVDLTDSSQTVIDHVNRGEEDGWVYAGGQTRSTRLFGYDDDAKIPFMGPGATLFKDNELVTTVVWGAPSSYVAESASTPQREPSRALGSAIVLGAALSTRAQSRGAYWGSLPALDNAHDPSALFAFAKWTFGQAGVLRVTTTRHHRLDSDVDAGSGYRVKDRVAFEMDVLEWDGENSRYKPFSAEDVQLEFTMLNPWVRTRFEDMGNGTFLAVVQVPDQIGIYKFVVEYHRAGVSPIQISEVVPVRPFLHNEYERFILQAVPYYTTAFSMLVGVLLLGIVLLYAKVDEEKEKKPKTSSTAQVVESGKEKVRRRKNRQS